jgi:hypothetical protein
MEIRTNRRKCVKKITEFDGRFWLSGEQAGFVCWVEGVEVDYPELHINSDVLRSVQVSSPACAV